MPAGELCAERRCQWPRQLGDGGLATWRKHISADSAAFGLSTSIYPVSWRTTLSFSANTMLCSARRFHLDLHMWTDCLRMQCVTCAVTALSNLATSTSLSGGVDPPLQAIWDSG